MFDSKKTWTVTERTTENVNLSPYPYFISVCIIKMCGSPPVVTQPYRVTGHFRDKEEYIRAVATPEQREDFSQLA